MRALNVPRGRLLGIIPSLALVRCSRSLEEDETLERSQGPFRLFLSVLAQISQVLTAVNHRFERRICGNLLLAWILE